MKIQLGLLLVATSAFAQFSPGGATISGTVTGQTLSANTGTINAGGQISITTNGVALSMTGTSNLINNGTIRTTGTGRAIDSNSGIATLNVTNAGLISAASTDAFRVNTNSAVTLTNSGTIQVTAGGQAIDWAAITSKTNSLTNSSTGITTTVGDDAVRPGTNGTVNNSGTITATPTVTANVASGSDGIDVRTFSGIQITNTGSITGRSGIATDGANAGPSAITINNNTGGIITGINGSGINIDGVSVNVTANVINQLGATIRGGVLASVTDGDGDGIDIDGVLTLNNSGTILGLGGRGTGNNPEALAIGGGDITNTSTGQIIGSALTADAPNGDNTKIGSGILVDNSNGGNAVAATTITNSGLIRGKSGFGVKIIGTFADTITNNAGATIRGAGSGPAIATGDGADTITNRGSIISDSGNALDLEAGNDLLRIEGLSAIITGDISGGTGSNIFINDGTFAYAGVISSFDIVEAYSGMFTLSGVSTYSGTTRVTGGTLLLDGTNRVSSSSALQLNGGTLEVANAGGPNGQTFSALSLTENSALDLDGTSLTFNDLATIGSGKTLTILDYVDVGSPFYAVRVLGDKTANSAFLTLLGNTTINGNGAWARFNGTYTDILPTPEPGTLGLLFVGGLLLVIGRRKL